MLRASGEAMDRKQIALVAKATENKASMQAVEAQSARLREERTTLMNQMAAAGLSWSYIGKVCGVTPQAAMYATGHAKRQKRKTVKADDEVGREDSD